MYLHMVRMCVILHGQHGSLTDLDWKLQGTIYLESVSHLVGALVSMRSRGFKRFAWLFAPCAFSQGILLGWFLIEKWDECPQMWFAGAAVTQIVVAVSEEYSWMSPSTFEYVGKYVESEDARRKLFQQADTNGDGVLDSTEVRDVLVQMGQHDHVANDRVEKTMAEMGTDGNAEVSFEEFQRWFLRQNADLQTNLYDLSNMHDPKLVRRSSVARGHTGRMRRLQEAPLQKVASQVASV